MRVNLKLRFYGLSLLFLLPHNPFLWGTRPSLSASSIIILLRPCGTNPAPGLGDVLIEDSILLTVNTSSHFKFCQKYQKRHPLFSWEGEECEAAWDHLFLPLEIKSIQRKEEQQIKNDY